MSDISISKWQTPVLNLFPVVNGHWTKPMDSNHFSNVNIFF